MRIPYSIKRISVVLAVRSMIANRTFTCFSFQLVYQIVNNRVTVTELSGARELKCLYGKLRLTQ
jgi:hypothetical protein